MIFKFYQLSSSRTIFCIKHDLCDVVDFDLIQGVRRDVLSRLLQVTNSTRI